MAATQTRTRPATRTGTDTGRPKAKLGSATARITPGDHARAVRAAATLLKQASDPTRLQIILTLAEGERNVGALCADLGGQSQPAISHHLALLRHSSLIEPRRQGKNNIYGMTAKGRSLVDAVRSVISAG